MKTILAFVIVCLLWPSAASAQGRTDREQEGLIGPVKSVETYVIHFSMKDGKTIQGARQPWHIVNYNIDGNITERVSYDPTGNISAKYFYAYDLKGRGIGYEEYSSAIDKTLATPRKHIYTQDDNGNRIEYKVIGSEGTPDSRFTYKYDANGNEIEYKYYYHSGEVGGRTVSTYDESGNQNGQIAYRADDSILWRISSIFDGAGNRIEQLRYDGNTLRYKITSRYDKKKRVLEEETMEFNPPSDYELPRSHAPVPGKIIYTYDDERRTKAVSWYKPDGSLKERIYYTFDDKGNQIEQASFKGAPKDLELQFYKDTHKAGSRTFVMITGISKVEIEYDSHGNWTRKIYLMQSQTVDPPQRHRIEERVIAYR